MDSGGPDRAAQEDANLAEVGGRMDRRLQELATLHEIAQTLNQAAKVEEALQTSLEKTVALMGLSTGWIFLLDHAGEFRAVADHGLPPALAKRGKRPIRFGDCTCQDLYRDGEFDAPVKNVECSRLRDERGEKFGLKNHASVALRSGRRFLGIMNVATTDWALFTPEDLQLLSAVGHQMSVAVERARLYEETERRSRDLETLLQLQRQMVGAADEASLIRETLEELAWRRGLLYAVHVPDPPPGSLAERAVSSGQPQLAPDLRRRPRRYTADPEQLRPLSAAAVPFLRPGRIWGALEVGSSEAHILGPPDVALLQAVAFELGAALDNLSLQQQSRQLAALQERQRLARDLHDSVTQTLFSLNLTSQAVVNVAQRDPLEAARQMERVQALAQSALTEMRSLIEELRPSTLEEEGLPATLEKLIRDAGLPAELEVRDGDRPAPEIEMAFYRILKEALHNAVRHAGPARIRIRLDLTTDPLVASIEDDGSGFDAAEAGAAGLGLSSMRQRARELGGRLSVRSRPGEGTVVRVEIPRR